MSENKLKPCPFCGGEAHFPTVTETWIGCKSCGFETPYTEDKEWLVNTWNTRKPIEKIVEQLEEKRKAYYEDYNLYKCERDLGNVDGLKNAIEIVKEGGTE